MVITATWSAHWESPVTWRAKVTLTTAGLDPAGALSSLHVAEIVRSAD